MRIKRALSIFGALLLLLVVGAAGYGYYQLRSSLMPTSGSVTVEGLSAPVEISFDAMGIPQVWAKTERDAYFALGWLHGGERAFQIESLRRLAHGRLSELFGQGMLELDKQQRALGFRRVASAQQSQLGEGERALIEAYVDGINRSITARALPFELQLLRKSFEPWTALDVLTISVFQSWYIDDLLSRDELLLDAVQKKIGDDKIRALLSVVESPPSPAGTASLAQASNAWAVSAAHSTSGASLLASDPHLDITSLPTFWYVVGLHAEDTGLDAVGITPPGSPFLIMGHNRQVAWGMTAAGVDLRDFFFEKLDPQDPSRYLTPEGSVAFERTLETIAVKGREQPVEVELRSTGHGPVVPLETSEQVLAVHWAGFDVSTAEAWQSFFALPRSRDWASFQNAAARVGALNVNWIFADAEGNVGYQLGAPIPLRSFSETELPQEGWTGASEWLGYLPVEEKPSIFAPEKGWVANCNNKPEGLPAGIPLPGSYHSDRIRRIDQILSRPDPLDVTAMKAAQLDFQDSSVLAWRDAAVEILRALGESSRAEQLAAWDGDMAESSSAAALLNVWRDRLNQAIFYDELQRRVGDEALERVYHDPSSTWYDDVTTVEIETRDLVLERSMRRALEETAGGAWGELNSLTFRHPFAGTPVLTGLLGLQRGGFSRGGSRGSLNASFYFRTRSRDRLATGVAPSWRRIVDFADVDGALMALPAGQSGHPMSPHFFDFFALWQRGDYWQVPISKENVMKRATSTLILGP
ncbi:MAG: penicillin acylase family protein [Thermoanaerobaculia bacterium]|nr:penicillin acylase family protein [Thermoanaerobaculia bacterium]